MGTGTREALIDAAAGLLDEGGVEAVTLREVGRRVGVSHNAPYRHFASKETLLAAVAARELERRVMVPTERGERRRSPQEELRTAMHGYLAWARHHPARFKLVFGAWSVDSEELGAAARAAQARWNGVVAAAQDAGALPPGDPVRFASLVRALAHGAADLASAGHLAPDGAGHLIDDLLAHLRGAAEVAEAG
ncbi:TetR/AcrR family transcriptional regulator [Streptomyces sp. SBT349]|uniref:TetR/AcrR family transcriptional regulator n=1 Tax=Streptomyces sp. SBT349 TaxID=1580539 RepID=UPI00066CEBE0|nr:TetR/AcrR family transcriptional regulator [Streptomyces sp. SBT349]